MKLRLDEYYFIINEEWEDKIRLQQIIRDLEKLASSYSSVCKDATIINNTLYYLKIIDEKIS